MTPFVNRRTIFLKQFILNTYVLYGTIAASVIFHVTHEERAVMTGEKKEAISPEQINRIEKLASEMRYGTITLVFQDGHLIQIEKNEKFRLK